MIELWQGDVDCVVFLQTIEHIPDPDAMLAHVRELIGPDGVAYVSTPNVLTLAPKGEERSGNPWHVREYKPGEYRELCERHFSRVDLLGLFHARKLRAHQVAIERFGWDRVHKGLRFTQAVLRPLHARDQRARLRAAPRRAGALARPAGGAAPMKRSASSCTPTCPTSRASGRGRSARSGCGRRSRPATCRCWTCSTPHPGQVTLSITPGAGRPARGAGRARALPGVPARGAARVARARRGRGARGRARVLGGALRGRRRRARAPRRPDRRLRARTSAGRARPPTPCCRCWPPTPACGCSWRPGSRRTASASAPGTAASGCPSARTRRGSTSCSRRPACTSTCVDWTDVLGAGPQPPQRSEAGVLLVPLDRAAIDLVWHERGYPAHGDYRDSHRLTRARARRLGQRRRRRTTPSAAPPGPAHDAADFVARVAGRRRRRLRHRALRPPLARGRHVPGGRARAGRRRRRSSSRDAAPAPRRRPPTSWGEARDLRTWSAPAADGLAWAQRSAELAALGADAVAARAARAARAAELGLGVPDLTRHRGRLSARARRCPPRGVRRGARRRSADPSCGIWLHSWRTGPSCSRRLKVADHPADLLSERRCKVTAA